MNQNYKDIKNKIYYLLIGVISILALVFLPMLGSDTKLGFNFPTTTVGWVVYIITKLCVAIINVLIFVCFVKQAEINIQDNENYIEAKKMLMTLSFEDYIPRAPEIFLKSQYKTKGITIALSTITACISLTNAILTFDLISFMTYIFTVIMAIVCGVLTMKNNEVYWTTEFYQYALYMKEEFDGNKQHNSQQQINCDVEQCTTPDDNN